MLAIYTGRGVAPQANLTERISHMPLPSANKAAHSGFETQRKHHQKSKTGVSVAPKMDMCPTKILKKSVCMFRYLFLGYHLEYIFLDWNLV